MSEWELFIQHLKQPEYIHVLLNPLPVYATAMGVLALAVACALRNRQAKVVALIVVILGCASAWPVSHWGHRGYDRVYEMSNHDAQQWLDVHAQRGTRFAYAFYATVVLAAAAIAAQWKFPKAATALLVATLVAAIASVGIGGWISHAGGQVRHSELREGPPPASVERHEHDHSH
jgi:disulfide bond formation protein DsbB